MLRRSLVLLAGLGGVASLMLGSFGIVACGPSFQAIYEGDARFEHCYALEEKPNVAMHQKGECWRDWLTHYTYGQTRDRVMYAASRAQAIRRAPELPTDEAMMHAAPGERGQRDWSAGPAPTSAFTPPPKTWGDEDSGTSYFATGDGGRSSQVGEGNWSMQGLARTAPPDASIDRAPPDASIDRPPLAGCTGECDDKWAACRGGCKGAACEACTRSYKSCIRSCAK